MTDSKQQELIPCMDARFQQALIKAYYALAPFDSETYPEKETLVCLYNKATNLMQEATKPTLNGQLRNISLYCLSHLIYENPDLAYFFPNSQNPKDLLHLAIEKNNPYLIDAVLFYRHKGWKSCLKKEDQLSMALMAFAAPRDNFDLGMKLVQAGASLTFIPHYKDLGLEDTQDTPLLYYLKLTPQLHSTKKIPCLTDIPHEKMISLLTHQDSQGENVFSIMCQKSSPYEIKSMFDFIQTFENDKDYTQAINFVHSQKYLENRLNRLSLIEHEKERENLSYVFYMAPHHISSAKASLGKTVQATTGVVQNAVHSVKETLIAIQGEFNFNEPTPLRKITSSTPSQEIKNKIIEAYLPGLEPT